MDVNINGPLYRLKHYNYRFDSVEQLNCRVTHECSAKPRQARRGHGWHPLPPFSKSTTSLLRLSAREIQMLADSRHQARPLPRIGRWPATSRYGDREIVCIDIIRQTRSAAGTEAAHPTTRSSPMSAQICITVPHQFYLFGRDGSLGESLLREIEYCSSSRFTHTVPAGN